MFKAYLIEEKLVVDVYAVDCRVDAFLIDYYGKFRWFRRDEFRPYQGVQ